MNESNKDIIRLIEQKCRAFFEKYNKRINGAHGWDHVERVRGLSLKIAKQHNSSPEFSVNDKIILDEIEIIALLHDIGRYKEDEGEHAEWSYELGEPILKEYKNNLININTEIVLKIVRNHTFYKKEQCFDKEIFDDIKFKIFTDADKIDSFGPIGILRAPLDPRFKTIEDQIKHIQEKSNPDEFELRSLAGQEIGNKYKTYLMDFYMAYKSQNQSSIESLVQREK